MVMTVENHVDCNLTWVSISLWVAPFHGHGFVKYIRDILIEVVIMELARKLLLEKFPQE